MQQIRTRGAREHNLKSIDVDLPRGLVLIDAQRGMFAFRRPLHDAEAFLGRVSHLLTQARARGLPVLHIRHGGGPGHLLAQGSEGWLHHPAVAPLPGEVIIDKRHSSGFQGTRLQECLDQARIRHVFVAGIQTEMCVDSTCRAAVALGYRVTLVSDAHSTFDSPILPAAQIIAHHNHTLGNGFVDLAATAEVNF